MTATAPALCARETRAIYRASQILERLWADKSAMPVLGCEMAKNFFRLRLAAHDREHFLVAFLDTKLRLIAVETLHMGDVDTCRVSPREVARHALLHNASSVILAHNHPSGDPTPSSADVAITEEIENALKLIDTRLSDHIIVGASGVVSMAEIQCMNEGDLRWRAYQEKKLMQKAKAKATRERNASAKAAA